MSILNFFRRNKSVTTDENIVAPGTQTEIYKTIDHNLFVEDEAPAQHATEKGDKNLIQVFLQENYELQGLNDGYAHPHTEYLDDKLKLIKSEFRLTIDKCLDAKRGELGDLKLHAIQIKGISERLEAQLNERVKQMEVNIHELDMQKILSIEDEGIVAPAVYAYRLGFIKGVERFQKEKLFAESTGLYN